MTESISHSWQIRKPAVSSNAGLVASQHYIASDAGAQVLRNGGNAIDAAIATGLTLGTVEPWMSGIGGGGYMTVYTAATQEVKVIDFGMRAPFDCVPEDYPLAGGGINAPDAFNWPKVLGDTNIHGPLAIAVPGYLAGISLALSTFGTMTWRDVIEPACQQADLGLPIDWFSAQKINQFARGLNLYDETRQTYLADGLPPAANIEGHLDRLKLGRLSDTYRLLRDEGPSSFYTGSLSQLVLSDLKAVGSKISARDFKEYGASINNPLTTNYRGATLNVSGNLTAGPSIIHALEALEKSYQPDGSAPNDTAYKAYADALFSAYAHRLENLGEGPEKKEPGNTSHICVSDKDGNVVSLTQTIMSAFGSRIMLPSTGILMNNGMMWFDPKPGGPNSVIGGRRPLCNMCPVILQQPDKSITAIGACGGRKIFPAVFQLAAFLTDYDMSIDDAVHQPRLDVSGAEGITVMDEIDPLSLDLLKESYPEITIRPNGVNPNLFALPQLVQLEASGKATGGCFIPSPHAKVSAAD
jgi:gamma-glutamyltranspeptidase/glutathione hydrolase